MNLEEVIKIMYDDLAKNGIIPEFNYKKLKRMWKKDKSILINLAKEIEKQGEQQ